MSVPDWSHSFPQSELGANLVPVISLSLSDVGKSSLLLRFADNSFSGEFSQLKVKLQLVFNKPPQVRKSLESGQKAQTGRDQALCSGKAFYGDESSYLQGLSELS